ncbi:antirestriction protein ArdA [Streptodolium elevatio]|uniref:Antirestriction protein ArdA n=1 Tax=Streptodolium elevatio TaxID=3157996 RepID=A0ABV3DCV8_9ACTN
MIALGRKTLDPQVWIGCVACYNNGRLVGEWYSADSAEDVTIEEIHAEHFGAPKSRELAEHEELWCFNSEGFGGLLEGETSPSGAQAIAELIGRVEDEGKSPLALAAFKGHSGYEIDDPDLIEEFMDAYMGEHASEKEFAIEQSGAGDLSEWPWDYIDWDSYTNDLFINAYWSAEAPEGVFVFCNA